MIDDVSTFTSGGINLVGKISSILIGNDNIISLTKKAVKTNFVLQQLNSYVYKFPYYANEYVYTLSIYVAGERNVFCVFGDQGQSPYRVNYNSTYTESTVIPQNTWPRHQVLWCQDSPK